MVSNLAHNAEWSARLSAWAAGHEQRDLLLSAALAVKARAIDDLRSFRDLFPEFTPHDTPLHADRLMQMADAIMPSVLSNLTVVEYLILLLAEVPAVLAELERKGRERALIYKTLILTGLRKGELASLTIGRVDLDGPHPHAILKAGDAKNNREATIPLRDDLAGELRDFLRAGAGKGRRVASAGPAAGPAAATDPGHPLFVVPRDLCRILDRDLAVAGIAKRDLRGRVVDVHAMRHTFGTQLHRAGVSLRTAQAAMRHSTPELTANVYTDPALLDVEGAIDALPSMPIDGRVDEAPNPGMSRPAGSLQRCVEPVDAGSQLALNLALERCKLGHSGANPGKTAESGVVGESSTPDALTCCGYTSLATHDTGWHEEDVERETGIEPATFSLGS